MKAALYMTGKAWESEAGRKIGKFTEERGFRNFLTRNAPGHVLIEKTVQADEADFGCMEELNRLLRSLDPAKGEFYEFYELLSIGYAGWGITSNRPKDLDNILGVRREITYNGKTQYEMEKE